MKKYLSIIAVAAMAAYATSAFAQGTVVFANSTGLVKQWTSATDSTLVNVGYQGGKVSLMWAAAGTAYTPWTAGQGTAAFLAANPGWKIESVAATIGTVNNAALFGKFNGGTLTLTPLTAGANLDYVVLGWTGSYADFDAALAAGAMANVSGKATSASGGAGSPPSTAVNLNATFAGMTLQPIPEPSTFALAGLGAAALLIFRRRK